MKQSRRNCNDYWNDLHLNWCNCRNCISEGY
nr:MAG TPA_asm: hypothetical protein [Caudoviricetes sp.]